MRNLAFVCLLVPGICLGQIPDTAWQHRPEMVKSAWRVFGPGAPVATLAAQIHQESAWKINARSWAGAEGLAQFMPATAADMARRFPSECAPANQFNPKWAFTCRDRYLQGLIRASATEETTECDSWAFGLRAYNGGLTWIRRDRALAAEAGCNGDDWRQVAPFNAGRRESAHRENREYPERIFRLEARYLVWGEGLECEETPE